jgi:hypothetical protein
VFGTVSKLDKEAGGRILTQEFGMMRNRFVILALLLAAATRAHAREPGFAEFRTVQESLSRVHPRMRASWLKERGIRDEYWQGCVLPADSGLHEAGRWSFGPSYDVDGRVTPSETLVALARGSGVSLLRFSRQDSLSIELLSDINAGGLMKRVAVRDTLLYVGSTAGLEVWNIADERNPTQLSWLHTALNDFDVQDSLAYVIGPDDSFKVYNVADPQNPAFRGACRDSGYVISVCNGYAYTGDRWGLYVVDVTNPASPHRIGSWGTKIEQVKARGTLCFVTTSGDPGEITFHVLDVTVPASPLQIGSLDQAGGNDVHLIDTLAFGAGEEDFNNLTVISIADSTHPRLVGSAATPGWSMGIWASGLNQATFVGCHWEGLQVYDTRNPAQPVRDTFLLGADQSVDICIDNGRAYVANEMAGLKILDVRDPTNPVTLGSYDTTWQRPFMTSVVARDSFAYVDWFAVPVFRVMDVGIPSQPTMAGGCDIFNPPQDMVLRDSFVYIAEVNRFQIVNVARPREPVLVGSCAVQEDAEGLCLVDTLAYVASYPFAIVNVKDPANPVVVGTISRGAWNGSVRDTFLFLSSGGILVYSVADPGRPRLIDSLSVGPNTYWVEAVGSLLYVGSRDGVRVIDASDVHNMRVRGFCSTPYTVRRLTYASPYIYASCYEAGVCVLESTQVGVNETTADFRPTGGYLSVVPNPATDRIALTLDGYLGERPAIVVRNVTGREVMRLNGVATNQPVYADVTGLPCGLYYVEATGSGRHESAKFVKR